MSNTQHTVRPAGSGRAKNNRKRRRRMRPTAVLLRILILLLAVLGVYMIARALGGKKEDTAPLMTETEEGSAAPPTIPLGQLQTTAPSTAETEPETESKNPVVGSEKKAAFSMIFTGDVWLEEIASSYDREGIDGILAPELLAEMKSAALTMINEEFPFGNGGTKVPDKQFTFRVDPAYVSAFTDMGVDLVSLANNHALDYGKSTLTSTFNTLNYAGIDYVGAGETPTEAKSWKSYTLGGTKVAVLAATRVLPTTDWNIDNSQPGLFSTYNSAKLNAQIAAAKKENDLVIVYVHWGIEKSETPEDYQRTLAQGYIENGADLVIGSHPHVLQGIEYYKNKPIVYSLGNFMFHSEIDRTAMLKVNVSRSGKMSLQLIPAAAADNKTYMAVDEEAQEILEYVESISENAKIAKDGSISKK